MPNILITADYSSCSCHSTPCCCAPHTECTSSSACPIQLDAECVFYNKLGATASLLTNLGIPNGVDLKTILEAIDATLGLIQPYNFPAYNASCINYAGYIIDSMTNFLTAVDNEFCSVKTSIGTLANNLDLYIANLTTVVDSNNHPQITDGCGLGIITTDTVKDVLIKLKNGYCTLSANTYSDTSPVFTPAVSSSITWVNGGTKNHAPSANVRKSTLAGNNLEILSDGLYVGEILATTQVLSYNPGLRELSLSGGGGTVVLPEDKDEQTLSLDTVTKRLTISNGNFVDLTPITTAAAQTPITPNSTQAITLTATGTANTNLTAILELSANAGNSATIEADGLYVGAANDKVKASSIGVVNGYLIDKLNVNALSPITGGAAYNGTSDKVDITVGLNETTLLSDIAANNTLSTALYNIVLSKMCFRFRLHNTDVSPATYNYVDCSGTTVSSVSLAAGNYVTVLAKGVYSANDLVLISNLGINF